ncbi:MAG: tRNA pseudouridine(38-40) synthase TruA [Polyangiaceae bacterium]|nr:tRNA pseudouridine(38-40) synthase TruA [Polyangiaceae bacterium]
MINTSQEEVGPAQQQKILLLVAYWGSAYCGMVRQENGRTVAGELEKAIAQVDPAAGRIYASSRTDAGVHANRQPVSFLTHKPGINMRGWILALAPLLPPDISITYAARVPESFDPRRAPLWKRYEYQLLAEPVSHAHYHQRAWHVRYALNLERMQHAAQALIGTHDFGAFRSSHDTRDETIRTLSQVEIRRHSQNPQLIKIKVQGDRFMHNMVRIICGSLVDIGRGKLEPEVFSRAFASQDRRDLGMTAPAHGLYLDHVELREWGEEGWPRLPQEETDSNQSKREL